MTIKLSNQFGFGCSQRTILLKSLVYNFLSAGCVLNSFWDASHCLLFLWMWNSGNNLYSLVTVMLRIACCLFLLFVTNE
jgi:hypothetical protein